MLIYNKNLSTTEKIELLKMLLEAYKEQYQLGTLRREDYDKLICEIVMEIRNIL